MRRARFESMLCCMSDDNLPPVRRLTRLRKLAGLSARLGGEAMTRGVRKLTGRETGPLLTYNSAEQLVPPLGDLKGAAMKLGQALSMEPDLWSPEVRAVLSRLQNQAPAMTYDRVAEVVE